MTSGYELTPVGFIRSPFRTREEAPRQGRDAAAEATLDVLPRFAEALEGLDRWPTVTVVCWMHLAARDVLRVHPRQDASLPLTGVFSTRSPARPNPLALYTAELLSIEGLRLRLRGVDAFDGTPVLDLRPHVHRLDD